ncbi:hypothetical protein DFH08DRAFT_1077281 [Mycena albidolilacea]|uniref:Uncharacterized protein n=1 Tax=Mycena albidolilacea TaxID=1033008 RepID=A0AAD7AC79_9AGAR|nr:hypothetical protein DFH08DRAFT_1077281 [Mycena albidolilacea]
MSFTSTSTTSLVSNTTISSRTPLNSNVQSKDFQAAFASLQSTYGSGATAPSPVQKNSTSAPRPADSSPAARAPLQTKNFQSAFTDLQSTYRFGGAVPNPVQKKNSAPASRSAIPSSATRTPLQADNKNFEPAFADLQSTYGFGGAVPTPVPSS